MKNTIQNKSLFESSSDFQINASPQHQSNQGSEVFFIVDVNELFGIDLNYPGIITALNKAFAVSREYTPYDSGVTYRSYTMVKISNTKVKVFYDPKKVIGANRFGRIVKDYYPAYIAEHASRFNWLSIVIKHFYDALFQEIMLIKQKEEKQKSRSGISLLIGLVFLEALHEEYKRKKEEAKQRKEQEKKQREERLKIYKELKIKSKNKKLEDK